jgi:hypothetical protein
MVFSLLRRMAACWESVPRARREPGLVDARMGVRLWQPSLFVSPAKAGRGAFADETQILSGLDHVRSYGQLNSGAIGRVQGAQNLLDFARSQPVVNQIAIATRSDEAQIPELCQVLGERRLRDVETLGQSIDAQFLVQQVAEDHQPLAMRHGGEQLGGVSGTVREVENLHFTSSLTYAYLNITDFALACEGNEVASVIWPKSMSKTCGLLLRRERRAFKLNRFAALSHCGRIVCAQNRFPLLRTML